MVMDIIGKMYSEIIRNRTQSGKSLIVGMRGTFLERRMVILGTDNPHDMKEWED